MKRFLIPAFFAVSLFVLDSAAQSQAALSPQLRQKTFEKIWQIVDEKYWDPTFGGLDWKAARSAYSPQVAGVKTDAEFYELMAKMLAELKTSHLDILSPETIAKLKQPPVITGLGLRELDGRIVITKVMENSSAAEAGLKPGLVIARIDGEPVKALKEVQAKLNGTVDSKVKLTYLDGDDAEHEAILTRRAIGEQEKSRLGGVNFYGLFEAKRLDDGIGYIRFSNFLDFLNPRIKAAVESMHDAPGIIIDLRGNSGGDDSVGLKLANFFFEKETLLMITKTRKGDEFDYKAKPVKNPFRGEVAILVDEYSRSASEEFSAGMQSAGRAVVIGKTTAGGDMDGELMNLPDGSIFLYAHGQPRTPKGYIVEGHGVKPDIEVSLTRKDLLAGKDAQLEAAIDYIRNPKP